MPLPFEDRTRYNINILSKGIIAHAHLFGSTEQSMRLVREISTIYLYGLMGKSDKAIKYKGKPERS